MFNYYSTLSAEVYDLDKHIGRSFGDVEFYTEKLSTCSGPILEPGVGNGRILIPLLEKGLDVDGLDLSMEMLERCRKNCHARGLDPDLVEGRMESFSMNKVYDAIIIPTGTFLLLHRREDSLMALKNFHGHLKNGGKLFIDLFLQEDRRLEKTDTRVWEVDDETIVLESKIVEIDEIHQYTVSHHRYEKWKNGKLIQKELERFPLRWYGVEEFKLVLENTGFSNVVISGNYQYGKYPENSSEVITFEATAVKNNKK